MPIDAALDNSITGVSRGPATTSKACPAAMLPGWRTRLEKQGAALSPQHAEQLLRDAGVETAPSAFASTAAEAEAAAGRLGYPVALKTAMADLLHKTEAGGVNIGIRDAGRIHGRQPNGKKEGAWPPFLLCVCGR